MSLMKPEKGNLNIMYDYNIYCNNVATFWVLNSNTVLPAYIYKLCIS